MKSILIAARDLMRAGTFYYKKERNEDFLVVFMYHRVLPKNDYRVGFEEPGMYVLPETLELHLKIMKRYFQVVDLKDELKDPPKMDRKGPRCAITFDDGWLDNYEYAEWSKIFQSTYWDI